MPTKDKYINPLTDFGFKRIFGTEKNKDLLIDFLNQILPVHHQILDLTYGKNEHLGETSTDRKAIFDIFCKSKSGEFFIIELQRSKQEYFRDRSIYYSTHTIQSQAQKGNKWDFHLSTVYTIAILDFMFDDFKEDEDLMHRIYLKDEKGRVFYNKLSYIYIELPKFTKNFDELETHFEKWLFVFKRLEKLQSRPKALQERVFQKLFKLAEIAKFSPMERTQYEESLKQYRDYQNTIDYAKKEGIEEGIEKGMEKGREKRDLEIIKNALKKGYSIEIISDFTNISIGQIKKIIADHKRDFN